LVAANCAVSSLRRCYNFRTVATSVQAVGHVVPAFSSATRAGLYVICTGCGNPSQSYRASPAIWDCIVLHATRHSWQCPTLTPATYPYDSPTVKG